MTISDRREFLTGAALRDEIARAGAELAERLGQKTEQSAPRGGDRLCLSTRAMACDFEVFLNPDGTEHIAATSAALDLLQPLEQQLTVYRPDSELSRINASAFAGEVSVEPRLRELLETAVQISTATDGAFEPTSGPLVALWRQCRDTGTIPTQSEIDSARGRVGCDSVRFDAERSTVQYLKEGVGFNLGAIGKGYAIDRLGTVLNEHSVTEWFLHAGASSILARGGHNGLEGWPVGIQNPMFPEERLATFIVRNRGVSTSGNGIQFFRHEGKRYGHILDPRTGWPVEQVLAVTVVAPTAAEADALSTAFFVLGVEKAWEYCHNHQEVGMIFIPVPTRGRRLEPVICGIAPEDLFFEPIFSSPTP